MTTTPMFSIITVSLNAEDCIEDTLKSVCSQDYKDLQYIVIDGGSNDSTKEIIERYKDEIDVLLIESDKGIYDAMNKGLDLAVGKYVNFLNTGDYFFSNTTLSLVAEQVNLKKPTIISGDFILENKAKGISNSIKTKKLSIQSLKKDFHSCHQTIFIANRVVGKYDLKYKIKADYKWVYSVVSKITEDDILKIDKPIVYYQQNGFSQRLRVKNIVELIKLHYELFGFFQVLKNIPTYIYRILRSIKNRLI